MRTSPKPTASQQLQGREIASADTSPCHGAHTASLAGASAFLAFSLFILRTALRGAAVAPLVGRDMEAHSGGEKLEWLQPCVGAAPPPHQTEVSCLCLWRFRRVCTWFTALLLLKFLIVFGCPAVSCCSGPRNYGAIMEPEGCFPWRSGAEQREGCCCWPGLGSKSVFASRKLCAFREVALLLWMAHSNIPLGNKVPAGLPTLSLSLSLSPSGSFCSHHHPILIVPAPPQ